MADAGGLQQIAVETRSVTKVFGQGKSAFKALDRVSVSINENEFFTLLGPSGCGKTTLLRLIAGFEFPTEGQILLQGKDIAALPPFKRPVNTVFQNYALFPHLTVAENIAFGLEMLGRSRNEIGSVVDNMLQLVRMGEMRDRLTNQISGGQQQRVALARALAPSPKVLLLDEPLSALDYKLRKEMQIELKRMQHETGITFIFVTHDQEEALAMSDRIAVMSAGRILQVGAPRDIYERPSNRFVADFIGESNFLNGTLKSAANGTGRIELAGGGMIEAVLADDASHSGEVAVVVRPEHARLVAPDTSGALPGTITNIVYSGTDTHYHVRLDEGSAFVVRSQNQSERTEVSEGDRVAIALAAQAARVLSA